MSTPNNTPAFPIPAVQEEPRRAEVLIPPAPDLPPGLWAWLVKNAPWLAVLLFLGWGQIQRYLDAPAGLDAVRRELQEIRGELKLIENRLQLSDIPIKIPASGPERQGSP